MISVDDFSYIPTFSKKKSRVKTLFSGYATQ